MTTGDRIKAVRKARHLSAEAIAEAASVSPATVYRYENGDIATVPEDKLSDIATALGVTPDYLSGKLEENLRAMDIKVSRVNGVVVVSDVGGLFDAELTYSEPDWDEMCAHAELNSRAVLNDFLKAENSVNKKPAPEAGDELTPAQRRAWEFVKQMDDETLDRFIAAAKAFIK